MLIVQGIQPLLEPPSSSCALPTAIQPCRPEAEVESEIKQRYREAELVFDKPFFGCVQSTTCSMETKHSPSIGHYIELRSTTPLTCSASATATQVWRHLCVNPIKNLSFFNEVRPMKASISTLHLRTQSFAFASPDVESRFLCQEVPNANRLSPSSA